MPLAVIVAPDRLEVVVELPAGEAIDGDGVREMIARHGLRRGLLRDALIALTTKSPEARRVVVARGEPPEHGADGRIEHLAEPRARPDADAIATIDPHELSAFVEVDLGQPLARVVPPEPGKPGVDVRGDPIPARAGKPADPDREYGAGTRRSAADPQVVESALLGVMRRAKDGRREVVVPLMIEGDVDFHCGNIDTRIAVVIRGDIKAGFTVKSADGILVQGAIEDARVTSQGDLEVRGGILPGAERVKAHGLLQARFIAERPVKARDVHVLGSIRHANVLASHEVTAKEIVGGQVMAGRSVECGTLGSPAAEARTLVHVGVDPFAAAAIADYDRRCRETRLQVAAIGERGKLLAHAIDKSPREDDAGIAAIVDLRALLLQRSRLEAKIREWEEALVELRRRADDPAAAARAAVVVVTGYAHAGVEVVIGDSARLRLSEPLPRPRFHLDQSGLVQI